MTRLRASKEDSIRKALRCQEKGKMGKPEQAARLQKQETILRRHLSGSSGIQLTLGWYVAKPCSHCPFLMLPHFWYPVQKKAIRPVCAKAGVWRGPEHSLERRSCSPAPALAQLLPHQSFISLFSLKLPRTELASMPRTIFAGSCTIWADTDILAPQSRVTALDNYF